MRRYCIAVLAALSSFFLSSCKDDSGDSEEKLDANVSIVFSPESLSFSKSGGTAEVKVTTNASPVSAVSDADWLTVVSVASGEPSVVTLKASVNTDYDERSANITVACGGGKKTLSVTQAAEDLLKPSDDTNTNLVKSVYNLNWEGTTVVVEFETNGVPEVDYPWWVKADGDMERGDGFDVTMRFKVLKNYGEEREGKIVFTLGEETFACQLKEGKTGFVFADVNKTAAEIADALQCGWTFTGAEDSKSADYLNAGLIDTVAFAGVNVVRIPCSLVSDNAINELALANLKTALDVIVAKDMYAIVSLKDDGWLLDNLSSATSDGLYKTFDNVWSLIADALNTYDYHVIFEGYDQILSSKADLEKYKELNQVFVDAVRHTGANNYKRCLLIPSADIEYSIYAPVPTDESGEDRLLASFSFFRPSEYAQPGATKKLWGAEYSSDTEDWSGSVTESMVDNEFSTVAYKLRIPVVLNACGSVVHVGLDGDLYAASEANYIKYIAQAARNNSFSPIVYDDGACGVDSYGIFDRTSSSAFTVRNQYMQYFVEGAGCKYGPASNKK